METNAKAWKDTHMFKLEEFAVNTLKGALFFLTYTADFPDRDRFFFPADYPSFYLHFKSSLKMCWWRWFALRGLAKGPYTMLISTLDRPVHLRRHTLLGQVRVSNQAKMHANSTKKERRLLASVLTNASINLKDIWYINPHFKYSLLNRRCGKCSDFYLFNSTWHFWWALLKADLNIH